MKFFILNFLITTITIVLVGMLINFCRRRMVKTPHGLSGMCHRTGGEVCGSCADLATNREEEMENKSTKN